MKFCKKRAWAIYGCPNVNRKRFTFNELLLTLEVQKVKLAEKLVSLRKAKGMTQMKVAECLDVSRQAVSRWEVLQIVCCIGIILREMYR